MTRKPGPPNPGVEACPACGATSVLCLGALPGPPAGAVRFSTGIMPPAWLFECPGCTLRFRAPIPPSTTILSQYERLHAEDHWPGTVRPVWDAIRRTVEAAPTRTVLDVGCFRGDFLEWLGQGWDRYAIEPSASARMTVQSRGIKVLGTNVDDPGVRLPELGAITLIDVIEHLAKPMSALQRLADALVDGGRLVIFTGDTRAWAWRLSGRHYWYSALPEHFSFFSETWFHWAAPRMRCTVGRMSRHSHDPASLRRRLTETLQNVAYLASRKLQAIPQIGRRVAAVPFLRRLERHDLAWWTSSKDHLLIELIKSGAGGPNGSGLPNGG